jgi:hypothetical protein
MAEEHVRYETRSVKTVRGMEARVAAKWEEAGWEVVSQERGRLQSELQIRRVVPKTSRRAWAIGGGSVAAAVVVVVVLGATGVFGDDHSGKIDVDAVGHQATPAATQATSADPAGSNSPSSDDLVLSAASDPELASLLELKDNCDPTIGSFASKYNGRVITFDGAIEAVNLHGNYKTRYDLLIGSGDYSTTTAKGPAFQFNDVNTVSDLHYVGAVPDAIGVGTNVTVTAAVGEYSQASCLFQLKPVQTAVR